MQHKFPTQITLTYTPPNPQTHTPHLKAILIVDSFIINLCINKKTKLLVLWNANYHSNFELLKNQQNFFWTYIAKFIIVQFQLFKIIWFLNQIINIFNQWEFNFQKVCQILMLWTIQIGIVKPFLHHNDDLI